MHDYPVIPVDLLPNLNFDMLVIAVIDNLEEAEAVIDKANIEPQKVCRLLDIS